MIDIRAKGANGEREIYKALNPIVQAVMREIGFSEEEITSREACIQRNQNQTAVGGCDLSNTFGLAIEIKRQEQLSINTWWKQCEEAAKRNNELPVLLYRQNHKGWRCVTYVALHLPDNKMLYQVRSEFDWDQFLVWFRHWVYAKLINGQAARV